MSDIPVKVFIQRTKETTVHRFRGHYDFDGLKTVVGHIYGSNSKRLVVEYDDDEGDRVRIASEIEWTECQRLYDTSAATLLKLFVRRGKGEDKHRSNAKKDDSDSDCEQPAANDTPVIPKLALNTASVVKDATPFTPLEEEPVKKSQAPEYQCESALDQLVLQLVSSLFKCDAAHELMNPMPTVDFGSVIRRVVDPLRQEVHIDIDRQILRHRAIVTANAMLDAQDYAGAEKVLKSADELFKGDYVIEYNLACCAALQKNTEAALDLLEASVEHGYDKVQHLETDTDLENILSHPRVVALIRKMKGLPAEEVAPVAVAVPEPEPEVVTSVAPSATQDPNVRAVLSIFPDLTESDIKALLAENGNSVHKVVDFLLCQ